MDFISNLIKRPISLVLNETSRSMDKYQISASLPNTPGELENKKDLKTVTQANLEQVSNERPLSFSCNENNMTDFIGVPEEFLDEFKDILPPPPLCFQSLNPLTQSLLDMEVPRSLSITPSPPPLTPSMKVSQTIDELLSQINENLQQAGLNDDVLAIASPANKSELNPLSSKAALNSLKLSTTSSAASTQVSNSLKSGGPASLTIFENNSSLHKFPIDPELESCAIFDDTHATINQINNSDVNKSAHKFVGLTEFDETKIPELPGDLNPNIEEQYNVTFEKCFVPTFNPNQGSADPNEECKVNRMHFLLPTELDVTSDSEVFSDCNDDRDPSVSTFTEPASVNVTTEPDSYKSACNNIVGYNFNNTMDNIADITLEVESKTCTKNNNQTQMPVALSSEQAQTKAEPMDEDEAMDVDMDDTMVLLCNTTNNIEHVEKVLQHAENILQHLDDKESSLKDVNEEHFLLPKETDFVARKLPESTTYQNNLKEKELSLQEISLNKSIELHINKTKIECRNESVILNKTPVETSESDINPNFSKDVMNSSTKSNSSAKSVVLNKTETNLNFSTSLNSSENSIPSSPSFPIKTSPNAGFPRSPKAVTEKQITSPFLEKSDYLDNLQNHTTNIEKSTSNSLSLNEAEIKNTSVERSSIVDNAIKLQTCSVVLGSAEELKENSVEFSIDTPGNKTDHLEKRRTFNVNTDENVSNKPRKSPSLDEEENKQLTFNANDTTQTNLNLSNENDLAAAKSDINPRRTFNMPIKQNESDFSAHQSSLNKSFEAMEVDENNTSRSSTILSVDEKQTAESHTSTDAVEKSQSPQNSNEQQSLEYSILADIQQKPHSSINSTTGSESFSVSRSQSPTLPIMQLKTQSPPLPTLQSRFPSCPPLPDANETNPSVSCDKALNIKVEQILPSTTFESINSTYSAQPLSFVIQKRPPIRDARTRVTDILSAKEQSNIKSKDEKDIFVEKSTSSPTEEVFTGVSNTSTTLTSSSEFSSFDQASFSCSSLANFGEEQTKSQSTDDEFTGNSNLILNPSDFDYLLTKGNNNVPVDRSSLLLKFDPLLGIPVPVNQGQPQFQISTRSKPSLSPTLEEEDHNKSNHSFVIETEPGASAKLLREQSQGFKQQLQLEQQIQQNKRQLTQGANKKNATMSVDVIKDMSLDNDCNKTFENSNSTQSDDKQINYKMDELEKKVKNEVLKTEDIEKKLKDAEQREEALIKRITEKDKTIAKMTGVIEAYEKAIAELIADKEQLTQNYEKQLAEVKGDRDSNYHHLTSLETTFSDLHVKYEKSKEMTCQLKESEETLQAEKRKNLENLHLQEQRYDKMKNHAMQQLEIANKKLESLTREHSIEITKLKALLKKEEIARSSINEQLSHKTKENAELVKICDELISGQGSNFSFEPFDPKKH